MKRLRTLIAAIAALVLTTALMVLSTSPAAAVAVTRAAPPGHGTCTAIDPGSPLRRQGAAWFCFKAGGPATARDLAAMHRLTGAHGPATARGAARDPAVDPANPLDLCMENAKEVNTSRSTYCVQHPIGYRILGADGTVGEHAEGVVVTSARVGISEWKEEVRAAITQSTPKMPTMMIGLRSDCTGPCTGGAAFGGGQAPLPAVGRELLTSIAYKTTVVKGGEARSQPLYHMTGTILTPGTPVNTSDNWQGPLLRCDNKVGNGPGCADDRHMANVTFHKSRYRAAAVTYEWAQKTLKSAVTGTKVNPLHRDPNSDESWTDTKRRRTCKNLPYPFPTDPLLVPGDSCDEFPFARSFEGGKPNDLCVDILPKEVGGVWDVANVRVMRGNPDTAACVRSHVTLKDNTDAGNELSQATTSARILDGEAYFVIVDD
ncbi:NucA/NucB deoxyribonuclease domain-containing protein [Streptomyces atratus]|uniref:NucA/NucB deoxyribonuclease domain-containing protein n=1 Tax=Streptomyces atratus TaxID=1893 RepID=UPI00224F030C|nr:hypothetical protein [Streptomyces atratus]MCX5338488.1 hypothetical protein [Streptomyces atratus]MCX5346165.1 hypothetical protein [Streptomyces atratus]